jgi:hypothetical protein
MQAGSQPEVVEIMAIGELLDWRKSPIVECCTRTFYESVETPAWKRLAVLRGIDSFEAILVDL